MTSPLDPTVRLAEDLGGQPQDPTTPSSATKITKPSPEWDDIEAALKLLDATGHPGVRKCVEEMLADGNLTLDPTMDENGRYTGSDASLVPEEMYLHPDLFNSHKRRSEDHGNGQLEAMNQAEAFARIVRLAATLRHECAHRDGGIFGRAANYWGSKIYELSLGADGEESLAHSGDFLFVYGLITEALKRGTRCDFLHALLGELEGSIAIIEQEYAPFSLLDDLKEMLEETRARIRKHCTPDRSETSRVGFGGVVEARHDYDITAVCRCAPGEERVVAGRVHGWTLHDGHGRAGSTLTLTPPRVHQDCVLVGVEVNDAPASLRADQSFRATLDRNLRIRFVYRCRKDVEAEQQALLEEQRRAAIEARDRLKAQRDGLEAEATRCKADCDALRAALAAARAARPGAQADADARAGDAAAARGQRDAAQAEVDALEQRLRDWNAKTPEERDAAKRDAARDYERAVADANARRAAATRELQDRLGDVATERRGWAAGVAANGGRLDAAASADLGGIRANGAAARDAWRQAQDAIDQDLADAWQNYRDADVPREHARRMPGLRAALAAAEAAKTAAEAAKQAAQARLQALDARIAELVRALAACEARCRRVRAALDRAKLGLRQSRRRLRQIRDLDEDLDDAFDPEERRRLRAGELDRLKERLKRLQESRAALDRYLSRVVGRATRAAEALGRAETALAALAEQEEAAGAQRARVLAETRRQALALAARRAPEVVDADAQEDALRAHAALSGLVEALAAGEPGRAMEALDPVDACRFGALAAGRGGEALALETLTAELQAEEGDALRRLAEARHPEEDAEGAALAVAAEDGGEDAPNDGALAELDAAADQRAAARDEHAAVRADARLRDAVARDKAARTRLTMRILDGAASALKARISALEDVLDGE